MSHTMANLERRLVDLRDVAGFLHEKKASKSLSECSNDSRALALEGKEGCSHHTTTFFPDRVIMKTFLTENERDFGSNARNVPNQLDNSSSQEITLTQKSNSTRKIQCLDVFRHSDNIQETLSEEDLARYATDLSLPQGDEGQVENCSTAQLETPNDNVRVSSVRSCASQTDNDEGEDILGKRTNALPAATSQELLRITKDTRLLRLERVSSVLDDFTILQLRKDCEESARIALKTERRVPDEDAKEKYRQLFVLRRPDIVRLVTLPVFGPNNFGDFTSEGARLQTFERYEPASHPSALRLANAGFYFTGREHTLRCYSCGVTFSYTEDNRLEDPYRVHRSLSPSCPHVNGQDRRNIFVQDGQRRAQSSLDITGQGAVAVTSSPSVGVQDILHEARQGLQELRTHLAQIGFVVEPLPPPVPHPAVSVAGGEPGASAAAARSATGAPIPPEQQLPNGVGHQSSATNTNQEGIPFGDVPHDHSLLPAAPTDITSASEVADRLRNLQEPVPNGDYDPGSAAHANYGDYRRRLASYGAWPDTHAQSPEGLALSGFFHTGIGDCVRCHYCGLGLKHWDPDDRPLDEHVRWRSSCGYLRALCGDDVIARILATLGRRQRQQEGAGNEGTAQDETAALWNVARNGHSIVASVATNGHVAASSNPPASSQNEPPTPASFMTSSAAQRARDMGFSDDVIQQAITALLNTRAGARAVTSHNLVQAILYIRQRNQREEDDWNTDSDSGDDDVSGPALAPQAPLPVGDATHRGSGHGLSPPESQTAASPGEGEGRRGSPTVNAARVGGSNSTSEPSQNTEQLERENRELRDRRRCKICLDNDISILFLPCGHLVCCAECAAALLRCPICRVRIRGRVRTQMAPLPSSSANTNANGSSEHR